MIESSSALSGWRKLATDLKLFGEAIQPMAIIVGGILALLTYMSSVSHERYARDSDLQRARLERAQPYYEKQLNLYLEAARVAAHLAANPASPDRNQLVARFWELYWGELAFVESRSAGSASPPTKPIEELMVEVCETYVSSDHPEKCHSGGSTSLGTALALSHRASDEIRKAWDVQKKQ